MGSVSLLSDVWKDRQQNYLLWSGKGISVTAVCQMFGRTDSRTTSFGVGMGSVWLICVRRLGGQTAELPPLESERDQCHRCVRCLGGQTIELMGSLRLLCVRCFRGRQVWAPVQSFTCVCVGGGGGVRGRGRRGDA